MACGAANKNGRKNRKKEGKGIVDVSEDFLILEGWRKCFKEAQEDVIGLDFSSDKTLMTAFFSLPLFLFFQTIPYFYLYPHIFPKLPPSSFPFLFLFPLSLQTNSHQFPL